MKGVRWVRFRCLVLAARHRILVANDVNQNDFNRLTGCHFVYADADRFL